MIRAKVVVISDDFGAGIGVECYRTTPPDVREVYYIASIYVDRFVLHAEGIRIAIQQLRAEYGKCELCVKTPHAGGAFQAQRKVKDAKIRADSRRKSVYSDTALLAEDAIKRRTTITERL